MNKSDKDKLKRTVKNLSDKIDSIDVDSDSTTIGRIKSAVRQERIRITNRLVNEKLPVDVICRVLGTSQVTLGKYLK